MSMQQQPQRKTVQELLDTWKLNGDFIPLELMPPWNDICSKLTGLRYSAGGYTFRTRKFGFPGIYRLIGVSSNGKPAVISRAGGEDTTGTLYIGCARRLSDRLNAL